VTRRLELPEELVFSDGATASSPDQLVAQLENDTGHIQELHSFFQNGHLELWLRRGGWAALGQWVLELQRHRGGQDPADFAVLLCSQVGDQGVPPIATRPALPTAASVGASATAQSCPYPDSPPAVSLADMIVRQRHAFEHFRSSDSHRAEAEEIHIPLLAQQEAASSHTATAQRSEAERAVVARRQLAQDQVRAQDQARKDAVASVAHEDKTAKTRYEERYGSARTLISKTQQWHAFAVRTLRERGITELLDDSWPKIQGQRADGWRSLEQVAQSMKAAIDELESALNAFDEWKRSRKKRRIVTYVGLLLLIASVVFLFVALRELNVL